MRTRTRAHVSTAGVTTSAPARSDNHQVRQMCPKPTAGRSPAIQIASVPSVAPTAGADGRARDQDEHVPDPQAGCPRPQADEQQGRDDDRDHGAERLTERDSERRGVVAGQEIADHDRGPQSRAEQHERSDADSDCGPERRDGAVGGRAGVRVGEVEPDASSGVVGGRRHDHRHQVAPLDQPLHHAREHLSVKLRAGRSVPAPLPLRG